MSSVIYKNAHGAIVTYDISDWNSFEALDKWIEELRSVCTNNLQILILGNKKDLEANRTVPTEIGRWFAQDNNLLFMEVSAKDNSGGELQKGMSSLFESLLK